MNFDNVEIGVNSSNIEAYLAKIKAEVIDQAIDLLKNNQAELFEVFRANWKGTSEQKFEEAMTEATDVIIGSLAQHFTVLRSSMYAVNNAWVQQDQGMIGGGN